MAGADKIDKKPVSHPSPTPRPTTKQRDNIAEFARQNRPGSSTAEQPAQPRQNDKQSKLERHYLPSGMPRPRASLNERSKAPSIGGLIHSIQAKPSKTPYHIAAITSVIWLFIGGLLGWLLVGQSYNDFSGYKAVLGSSSIYILAASVLVPIALFWFIAQLVVRSQEMKLMASAMTEVAIRLAEPDKMAEQKVASVGQTIRRQVSAMDDAISRAIGRAGELEALVHNEVAALERSYSQNEYIIRNLLNELVNEREAIAHNGRQVKQTLQGVSAQVSRDIRAATDGIGRELTQHGSMSALKIEHAGDQVTAALRTTTDQTVAIKQKISAELPQLLSKMNVEQDKLGKVIEGANRNLSQLDVTLAKRTRDLNTNIAKRTRDLNTNMAKRTMDLNATLTKRATDLDKTLAQRTATLDDKLVQRTATMDGKLAQRTAELDNKIAQRTTEFDSRIGERSGDIDGMIARHTGELNKRLVQKVKALDASLSMRTKALDKTLTSKAGELSKTLLTHQETIDATMQAKAVEIDKAIATQAKAMDASLTQKARTIDTAFDQRLAALDEHAALSQAKQKTAQPELQTPAQAQPELQTPAQVQPELQAPAQAQPELQTPAQAQPELQTPAQVQPELQAPAQVQPELQTPAQAQPLPASSPEQPATPDLSMLRGSEALERAMRDQSKMLDNDLKQNTASLDQTINKQNELSPEITKLTQKHEQLLNEHASQIEKFDEQFKAESSDLAATARLLENPDMKMSAMIGPQQDKARAVLGDIVSRSTALEANRLNYERSLKNSMALGEETADHLKKLLLENASPRAQRAIHEVDHGTARNMFRTQKFFREMESSKEALSQQVVATVTGMSRSSSRTKILPGKVANTSTDIVKSVQEQLQALDALAQISGAQVSGGQISTGVAGGARAGTGPNLTNSPPHGQGHPGQSQKPPVHSSGLPPRPPFAKTQGTAKMLERSAQAGRRGKADNKPSQWSFGDLLARVAETDSDHGEQPLPTYRPTHAGAPENASKQKTPLTPDANDDDINMDDIARAIDSHTAAFAWKRYQAGERGVFTQRLYNPEGQNTFIRIQKRYQNDNEFHATVEKYVADFEGLLNEANQKDPSGRIVQNYLTSETGRTYLMLAHISGRLD